MKTMREIRLAIDAEERTCGACYYREYDSCVLFGVYLGEPCEGPLVRCEPCLNREILYDGSAPRETLGYS